MNYKHVSSTYDLLFPTVVCMHISDVNESKTRQVHFQDFWAHALA